MAHFIHNQLIKNQQGDDKIDRNNKFTKLLTRHWENLDQGHNRKWSAFDTACWKFLEENNISEGEVDQTITDTINSGNSLPGYGTAQGKWGLSLNYHCAYRDPSDLGFGFIGHRIIELDEDGESGWYRTRLSSSD